MTRPDWRAAAAAHDRGEKSGGEGGRGGDHEGPGAHRRTRYPAVVRAVRRVGTVAPMSLQRATAPDPHDLLPLGPGPEPTFSQTFKTAGTFQYFCVIHPGMIGTARGQEHLKLLLLSTHCCEMRENSSEFLTNALR